MSNVELKPCPCGKTPTTLAIINGGQGVKYAYVGGNCCGEWEIEFRTDYHAPDSVECMILARDAWNGASRASPSIPPVGEEPAWWHHVDEHGRDVFMNMSFNLPNETALYIHPASTAPAESKTAKQQYDEIMKNDDEPDSIERLRFFLSLALKGQDWLDVEPFLDALCRCAPKAAMSEKDLIRIWSEEISKPGAYAMGAAIAMCQRAIRGEKS